MNGWEFDVIERKWSTQPWMDLEMIEANTCFRGCCRGESIPLHLPSSSYALSALIARGAESTVYEATLNGKRVAVKKPILSTSQDIDKFHKELQLLCKLDHPGVARLVAANGKPPNYMFFFQFYESGSLADKIHVEEWCPSIEQVLVMTLKIANALKYLHDLGIVHRDVKPANILLDRNLNPHLADFGLAEYKREIKQVSTENWKSSGKPTGGFHKKICELLTGVVPYTDLRAAAQAHTVLEMNYTEQQLTAAVVSEGLRPVLAGHELGAPANFLSLIQRCWDTNPQNRPSFDDIVIELDSILGMNFNKVKQEEKVLLEPSIALPAQKIKTLRSYQESINWFSEGEHFSKIASAAPDSCARMWLDSSSDTLLYHPVLSWGSFATCGRRETMEDTHFLKPHMCNNNDIHMFGIFDGHRGAAAAEFSARALPGLLQTLGSTSSPSDALVKAFIKADVAFRTELDFRRKLKGVIQKDSYPGCTAVVALIVRDKLFVANAGDCRTILCRAGVPYALSRDHVASVLEERERVISTGGQVKWQVDTWRVGPAALQVTRSIGDDDLKPSVTAEPEITETILSPEDEYLVMASDGLWDVMSNIEVVSIIKDTVKEPGMCSKRLATEAAERGSKDNITVIVVFLRPVSTAERIY